MDVAVVREAPTGVGQFAVAGRTVVVAADALLIVPLPDLILGRAGALLGALPPALLTYPLPERFTLPLALRDLILVLEGRLVVFLVDLLT